MKLASSVLFWAAVAACFSSSVRGENWPTWRGPRLDGTSLDKKVPVRWSGTSNVLWKAELPGNGHASPIVWRDRLFTVSVLPAENARVLLCLDRESGRLLWQKTVVV